MLVQTLELEYLQPESIQLEQPLVTITILNTDFENSFMRYWISTGATFGTLIPSTRKHPTGATFGTGIPSTRKHPTGATFGHNPKDLY